MHFKLFEPESHTHTNSTRYNFTVCILYITFGFSGVHVLSTVHLLIIWHEDLLHIILSSLPKFLTAMLCFSLGKKRTETFRTSIPRSRRFPRGRGGCRRGGSNCYSSCLFSGDQKQTILLQQTSAVGFRALRYVIFITALLCFLL